MQQKRFTIAENAPVARGTYRLRLAGDTAAITAPGQFADIRLAGYFLRRPVSVCSWSDGALTLYYKVAGAGTAQLSTLAPGTELDLLVGLGNGFDTAPAGARPLLVGGGVGASPLYGLAQQLVAEGRSPLAVLGFAIAAVLIVVSLVARVQLSQASAEVSALEDQYTQLQEQQTRLRIDYESAFNLTEIEDYAIHELGMQKPRSDQLYYISSDATDTAVVLDQNAAEPLSLADRLGDFFSSILEYFR